MSRRRATAVLGVCLLFAAGCGLGEYEKQMKTERERLDEYDLQVKYLGEPIKLSESTDQKGKKGDGKKNGGKKDKDEEPPAPSARVFIRPPKEISSTSKRKEGTLLRAYDMIGGVRMDVTFQAFYLGVALDRKQSDFRNAVLSPFRISASAGTSDMTLQAGGRTLLFRTLQTEVQAPMGTSVIRFYFYEEGPYQVAIIYMVLKSKSGDDAEKAITYSLRSLKVGDAAVRAESRPN